MGAFNNAYDQVVAALSAVGLPVATTNNAAQPGSVVVEPSSAQVNSISGKQRLCEFPIVCICPPPGDYRAMRALNDMADLVLTAVPATAVNPGSYTINGNDMPCITITAVYPAQQ